MYGNSDGDVAKGNSLTTVRYYWLHATKNLVDKINGEWKYTNIKDNNESKVINSAIKGLKEALNSIGTFTGAQDEATESKVSFLHVYFDFDD